MSTEQIHAQREVIVAYQDEIGATASFIFKQGMNAIDSSLWEQMKKRKDSRNKSTIEQFEEARVLTAIPAEHVGAVMAGRLVIPTGPVMPVQIATQTLAATGSEAAAIEAVKAATNGGESMPTGIKEPPAVLPRAKNMGR